MLQSEENLKAFIQKILEIKDTEKPISLEEMKTIAKELGMSEEDWQKVQQAFEGYLLRAEGYLKYNNWQDAIAELEQALAINPYHPTVLQNLTLAYQKKWQESQKETDRQKTLYYAERTITINPYFAPAFKIRSDLKGNEKNNAGSIGRKIVFVIALVVITSVVGVVFTVIENNQNSHETIHNIKKNGLLQENNANNIDFINNKEYKVLTWEGFQPTDMEVQALQQQLYISKSWVNQKYNLTINFKNTGAAPIKELRVLISWFNEEGEEIDTDKKYIIKKSDKATILPQDVVKWNMNKKFWKYKGNIYYTIKVIKAK